jgi:hypothetical protein
MSSFKVAVSAILPADCCDMLQMEYECLVQTVICQIIRLAKPTVLRMVMQIIRFYTVRPIMQGGR